MPIEYHHQDQRRLTIVTVTGPCSIEDILGVLDRQAREHTWDYAVLYDLRAAALDAAAHTDLPRIADRVKVLCAGRQRGAVGIAIQPQPALFLVALMYMTLTKDLVSIEVLLSVAQVHAWLARNAPDGASDQPVFTSGARGATDDEE
jgi:hypothetical protein